MVSGKIFLLQLYCFSSFAEPEISGRDLPTDEEVFLFRHDPVHQTKRLGCFYFSPTKMTFAEVEMENLKMLILDGTNR